MENHAYWGNYSDYLRQKEEERKNQVAEYEQFVKKTCPTRKGCGGKAKTGS